MRTLNTLFVTTSLLLGPSMSAFASYTQDETNPPSFKRLDRGDALPCFKSDGLPEGSFDTLPYELVALIISSLQRNDQVSVRRVSRKMKEIIDEHLWPNQSCTMKGECLSSAIDTIKSLPFRSLTLKFKRWESEDIQYLPLLTGLTALDVSDNRISAVGAESLSKLTGLTTLNVGYNRIGDVGTEALSKLIGLTTLDVKGNQIGDVGAKALAQLTFLTTIDVKRNQIGGAGVEALTKLTGLTSLDVSSNQIGGTGAEALSNLIGLITLDVSGNRIGDVGTEALSKLIDLTTLNVGFNRISDVGTESLSKLTGLTTLDVSYNRLATPASSLCRSSLASQPSM